MIDHIRHCGENHAMFFPKRKDNTEAKTERRAILAIDGGGMRGIIPAAILGRMNDYLRSKGDARPLYSHFDLIAGTSTGALLAAALSIPTEGTKLPKEDTDGYTVYGEYREKRFLRTVVHRYPLGVIEASSDPASFVDFYLENGPRIFPQKGLSSLLAPIFSDKYSATQYEQLLKSLYGEHDMSDLMVPTVMITYSTDNGIVYPITSWNNHGYKVWEGTRASSAAPLYFPLFNAEERDTGRKLRLIDGGIAANNPSLIAYSLGRKLYPEADEFSILSLSTAQPVFRYAPEAVPGGITGWGGQISRIFQNASLDAAEIALKAISDIRYTRVWAPVLDRKIRLDETGRESTNMLLEAASALYEAKKKEIEDFLDRLIEEPTHSCIRLRAAQGSLPPAPEAGL